MSRNSRRGVIFVDDVGAQANVIHNPNYDLGEEEAPLQRPRPPEAATGSASQPLMGSQSPTFIRAPQKHFVDVESDAKNDVNRRTIRATSASASNDRRRWSANRLSKRLSVILWGSPGDPGRPGPGYDHCQTGPGEPHQRHHYSCRELLCVALVPCVLLSLVAIGICSLLIYFHLLQEYQSKIDQLQAELQAVRDKDGAVYLPQEMYSEQSRKLEMQEELIRNMTKELRTVETQKVGLMVRPLQLFIIFFQLFVQLTYQCPH